MEGNSLSGLRTSERHAPDDGGTPERARSWRLWPPEISWDADRSAASTRGALASLRPAALWRNHRLFTVAACLSLIPRIIAALGFSPALFIQDSFSYMAGGTHLTPVSPAQARRIPAAAPGP